jgi:23S rRNA (guanosine2251-2'-O)-methyltransferase
LSGAGGSGSRRTQGPAKNAGRTKSGKPRPGTGGHGRDKLEGKGPTPPAALRPGHPAQRRAAAAAGAPPGSRRRDDPSASAGRRRDDPSASRRRDDPSAPSASRRRDTEPASSPARRPARGAGEAAEFVAGRNPVVESLRARVPAVALYVGARVARDDRIEEAIKHAADRGVPVLEAGAAELDRLTGGALHQGVALRVRAYEYAHPDDLLARAADAGQLPLISALDGVTDPRNLGAIVRSARTAWWCPPAAARA